MSKATSDVVIVGGGAAGCAVAYYLTRAGVTVTIIEYQGVGTQASGWSAGGVNPIHGVPGPIMPLALASFRLHKELWDDLCSATGHDCQARSTSMIRLISSPTEVPVWQETLEVFAATPGFAAYWLEPAEVYKLEPRLSPTILRGLVLEGNGVVDSFLYTTLLAQAATYHGATLRSGHVCGIQHANGRVTGVLLDDGIVACDQVVFAMGPWAKAAEVWLNVSIPIAPQKGEIVRLTLPGPALTHDFLSQDVELFSRSGGQVWCGATEEWCGFDTTPSVAARTLLLSKAIALMPTIAEASLVQHTACLRPVAPDRLPIIGKAPGWDNVYLATGGAHKGILLSPAMGKALADLITAGTTTLAIAPCAPERFTAVSA